MEMKTYKVSGMTCGSCAMRIENTLAKLDRVKQAHVDFTKRELHISSDLPVELSVLREAVAKLGAYTLHEGRSTNEEPRTPAWFWGVCGALLILGVLYLVQALGMQSWKMPLSFIQDRWYFITPLVIGFGIQAGIFRAIHLHARHGGGGAMATSGGVSSGTMLACCTHNLVPLFPILGASGLAAFFTTYQTKVFLVSIAITYLGVLYMIGKHRTIKKA